MTAHHRIAWADAVWDPVRGCSRKSAACVNCYAEAETAQSAQQGGWGEGFASITADGPKWTGTVALHEDRLMLPLAITRPSRIFVNAFADVFHEEMADMAIDRVFAVMATAPQHRYVILTKRQKKMQAYMADPATSGRVAAAVAALGRNGKLACWPPANLWLGVTTENQKEAERRVPVLLRTPAAVRFIAAEPLLSAVELRPEWLAHPGAAGPTIDWVMAGGESGPNARPIEVAWVRALRDQCARTATPFYWTNWGASMPDGQAADDGFLDGVLHRTFPAGATG
ncbi:MAG: phage Gp37/Gp68 family protein [Bradyrhizobiaceae bacterium]|nr:phage Gp37/Gp68 family protein [Bradyrhizobiaceae bacterium]